MAMIDEIRFQDGVYLAQMHRKHYPSSKHNVESWP